MTQTEFQTLRSDIAALRAEVQHGLAAKADKGFAYQAILAAMGLVIAAIAATIVILAQTGHFA